jgi:heptosyltransferase II
VPFVPTSFLVIQTAFIGDVILATALVEKLRKAYPNATIDFLLRKGNETLLTGHPHIREVLVWDKKKDKIRNLLKMAGRVRSNRYDAVINVHRYASSGLITAFSGAVERIGFKKNPWSFTFTRSIHHDFGSNCHEVDRNQKLIDPLTDSTHDLPRLYPSVQDFERIREFQTGTYICVAPTSVWYTKQLPANQWIAFIKSVSSRFENIYLLGAPSDRSLCAAIVNQSNSLKVHNLAGELSFLQSAAIMKGAIMNFVNDSAPMHLASAMDAPVTAVYCSTVPAFGFGPLSSRSFIVQTSENLSCRPCGSHGYKACPQGHFKCATTITTKALQQVLD